MKNILSKFTELLRFIAPGILLTFTYLFFDYNIHAAITIPPDKLIRPLLAMWLVLIPVGYIVDKITNDRNWSSIYVFLFVLFLYVSETYFEIVSILLMILIIFWIAIYFILRKTIIPLRHIVVVFALGPVLFLLVSLFFIVPFYLEPDWTTYLKSIRDLDTSTDTVGIVPENLPDIYYIVLDGYGRNDVLDEYYEFDNSKFIDSLISRGFVVPNNARANYAKTVISVASTLNMNYLTEFSAGLEDSMFWWQARPYIQHSTLQYQLEELGYVSITLATDWDINNITSSDIYIKPLPIHLSQYEGNLLNKSRLNFLSPFIERFAYYPTNDSHRDLVNFEFDTLKNLPNTEGPKFVFAHIVPPHPPFVFDKNGEPISPGYGFTFNDANDFPGSPIEYRNQYIGQLEYVNHRLEETIDAILAKSTTHPIIILQADHGPGMLTDFTNSETTCLKERFSVFSAYYLPGTNPDIVPEDITPVNIFRIVLNEYFSKELPLLENRSYYFLDTIYLFRIEDVTSRLNNPGQDPSCPLTEE